MDRIAVLIPCFNEEKTIEKVVRDFRSQIPEAVIYVYNNNSKDYEDFKDGEHFLQLSQTERDMIDLVTKNFKKVTLVYNGMKKTIKVKKNKKTIIE